MLLQASGSTVSGQGAGEPEPMLQDGQVSWLSIASVARCGSGRPKVRASVEWNVPTIPVTAPASSAGTGGNTPGSGPKTASTCSGPSSADANVPVTSTSAMMPKPARNESTWAITCGEAP